MAVITANTFDPLKARCNVRLQQGVPIVDADWNELDDVRKFELRAYLKWFVGDGIPEGSNAFRIDAITGPALADDFIIRAGVTSAPVGTSNYDQGLRFAGRAIADGLDVMIKADTNYKAQPLFAAVAFGVPQVAPMPNGAGLIAVYLDIWERLVTPSEDPSQVLPGIGTESCARIKREWVVRTRSGNTVPQLADADFIAGHSYLLLSVVNRSAPGATIAPADVQDSRHLHLSLTALESRVALVERLLLIPSFVAPLSQFSPKNGPPGQPVNLNGRNFNLGSVTVAFGGLAATIVGTPTANLIVANVPAGAPVGSVKITVTTVGGSVVSDDSFNVLAPPPPPPAPAFAAPGAQFAPKTGPANQPVTLTGANFDQAGLQVTLAGTVCPLNGVVTATQIPIKIPAVAAGGKVFTVTTVGGSVTSTDIFTVI